MADKGASSSNEFKLVKAKKRKSTTTDQMDVSDSKRPHFPAVKPESTVVNKSLRKVPIPPNRYAPLKENWTKIYGPLVKHLKLRVKYNIKARQVEIQTSPETSDIGALQKAADFVRAFALGFSIEDALALIRLDELFLESFDVKDVKTLKGDHLSRAVGRVAGSGGKVKFTIENVTKTRIVLADTKVHILGSYTNIRTARTAICNLILGSPASKVYGTMRAIASRTAERF